MLNRCSPNRAVALSVFLFLFMIVSPQLTAQPSTLAADLDLITTIKLTPDKVSESHPYVFKEVAPSFRSLNPFSLAYGAGMFAFEHTLLPHFSSTCLYHPGCTKYSKISVRKFGLVRGGLLSIDRLNRCNRIGGTDIHPSQINPHTHKCTDAVPNY